MTNVGLAMLLCGIILLVTGAFLMHRGRYKPERREIIGEYMYKYPDSNGVITFTKEEAAMATESVLHFHEGPPAEPGSGGTGSVSPYEGIQGGAGGSPSSGQPMVTTFTGGSDQGK